MPASKKSAQSGCAVTPLLPVTIQPGNIRYAPGVRAGRWVFATGHKGTADFVSGSNGVTAHPDCADFLLAGIN